MEARLDPFHSPLAIPQATPAIMTVLKYTGQPTMPPKGPKAIAPIP